MVRRKWVHYSQTRLRFFAYSLLKPNVQLNYIPTGSSSGVNAIITEQEGIDWTGSDKPLSSEERETNPNVIQLPFLAGAIVPILNIPGMEIDTNFTLTFDTIGKIFTGRITKWSDVRSFSFSGFLFIFFFCLGTDSQF